MARRQRTSGAVNAARPGRPAMPLGSVLAAMLLASCATTSGPSGIVADTRAPLAPPSSLTRDIPPEPARPPALRPEDLPPAWQGYLFGAYLPWARSLALRLEQGRAWSLEHQGQ